MKTETDFETQGLQDARTLIVGTDAEAKRRFIHFAGDLNDEGYQTEGSKAYIAGFRLIADAYLRDVECRSRNSDDPECRQTAFANGDISVFREGTYYVYYVEERELLAYPAP